MTNDERSTKHKVRKLGLGNSLVIRHWSFVISPPVFVFLVLTLTTASAGEFAVEQKPDRLIITHGGEPVAHYIWKDERVLRPFFAHVYALGGIQVSRNFPPVSGTDPTDHETMHPGIWLGFGDISGHDFWRNKAVVKHERFLQLPKVGEGKLTFTTENSFQTTQGQLVCKQASRFSLSSRPAGYLLIWDASFDSSEGDFTFGDQEEMGLGVRVTTKITEKNGGTIRSSEGGNSAKVTWGKPAKWCDYSGTVNERSVGIAIFSAPENFRPSWWHNRDYGLFVANPFGRKALTQGQVSEVRVKKGKTFQLRFGVLLHSSGTNQPVDIVAAYEDFVTQ